MAITTAIDNLFIGGKITPHFLRNVMFITKMQGKIWVYFELSILHNMQDAEFKKKICSAYYK